MGKEGNMKSAVILFVLSFGLISCNKGSDSASATDPIYGTWTYLAPGATSTVFTGYGGTIKEDGSISLLSMKAYDNGITPVIYYRANIGKYVRTGDTFVITYSKETCNPMGTETIILKYSNSQLLMTTPSSTTIVAFSKASTSYQPIENLTMIEDTACNKF